MQIEKRHLAGSEFFLTRVAQAVWSAWSVRKAVKEGYQANGWVYRAVSLIAGEASSVPWVVFGPKNEMLWDHPVSRLMREPNPHWTRQQLIELLVDWLELAGNAYMKKVRGADGMTAELWPVSPDRIAPIPSADPSRWIDGYEIIDEKGVRRRSQDFTPENVIHIRLLDPSNPYGGISPLGAAARSVDLDNSQQDWNVATMQNRGVPDGVFTFKQPLDEGQGKSITQRLKERFFGVKKAREPIVIGSDATYHRLSLAPVEMDYIASRKLNREEIFGIFGVPPQLAGAQDVSTYNNFATSNRVFWETTILPLLDRIRDALQMALAAELGPGETIGPDLSNVRALQESEADKVAIIERYARIGVPFSQLNDRFELGFTPWDGWDKPRTAGVTISARADDDGESREWAVLPLERRNIADEMAARDRYAEGPFAAAIADVLAAQRQAVFAAMDDQGDVREAAKLHRDEWHAVLLKGMTDIGLAAGAAVLDGVRGKSPRLEHRDGYSPELIEAVERFLSEQGVILRELSLIEETTVRTILEQVVYGVENEMTIAQIQQAILDTGVFDAERALRIARTEAATAMGSGQLAAGELAGATRKTWVTSVFETREIHAARDGEAVGIAERFSVQSGSVGPRFPGDPEIAADDRINCRCAMSFE